MIKTHSPTSTMNPPAVPSVFAKKDSGNNNVKNATKTMAPTGPKTALKDDFVAKHDLVILEIREATNYIKKDKDNDKVKNRIESTDDKIIAHKEYIKEQDIKVRADAAEFEALAASYDKVKIAYEAKRDQMANDDEIQAILEGGANRKQSFVKSVKKMVKGKPMSKEWNPHSAFFVPSEIPWDDAMDTITKAIDDLPRLESELRATVELPKRQVGVVQEYQDLLEKTNAVIASATPLVEQRRGEWESYVKVVSAEVFETKKEKKANPTPFTEAVAAYKDVRAKVAPLVGAKKKGGCTVM